MKKSLLRKIIKEEIQSKVIKTLGLKPKPNKKDYIGQYGGIYYDTAISEYISYLLDYIKIIQSKKAISEI